MRDPYQQEPMVDDGQQIALQDLFAGAMAVGFSLFGVCLALVADPGETTSADPVLVTEPETPPDPAPDLDPSSDPVPDPEPPSGSEGNMFAKPVTAIFVIDMSPSMEPALPSIRIGLDLFADIASRLSPRFKLEIFVHVDREIWQHFPMTEVGAHSEEGGLTNRDVGREELSAFMYSPDVELSIVSGGDEGSGMLTGERKQFSRMTAVKGFVDTPMAVSRGVASLQGEDEETRTLLCVIGDGALEEILPDANELNESERRSAATSVSLVKRAFEGLPNARFWCIYTGPQGSDDPLAATNESYFRDLAEAVGERGRMTTSVLDFGACAVEAVFGPPGQEGSR